MFNQVVHKIRFKELNTELLLTTLWNRKKKSLLSSAWIGPLSSTLGLLRCLRDKGSSVCFRLNCHGIEIQQKWMNWTQNYNTNFCIPLPISHSLRNAGRFWNVVTKWSNLTCIPEKCIRSCNFQQMKAVSRDGPVDWSCVTRLKKLFVPVILLIFRIRLRNILTISPRMPERTWTNNDNQSNMFRRLKCTHVETTSEIHVLKKCDSD
jgi:hypothetical protein